MFRMDRPAFRLHPICKVAQSIGMRILFVCLGNICRSPTAEAVLRQKRPFLQVDSAGTGSWHVGDPPYGPMQEVAREAGYEMADLRARQLAVADFDRFDLILGMDADNVADIEARAPQGASAQIACLADFISETDHVPDPYYTRDFDGALALIEQCVDAMIQDLALDQA